MKQHNCQHLKTKVGRENPSPQNKELIGFKQQGKGFNNFGAVYLIHPKEHTKKYI